MVKETKKIMNHKEVILVVSDGKKETKMDQMCDKITFMRTK